MLDKLAGNPTIIETTVVVHSKSWWKLLKVVWVYQVQGAYITKNVNLVVWVIYGITLGWLARIKILHYRDSLRSMLWNGMCYSRFVVRCSGGILLHGLMFILTKFKSSLNQHYWSLGYSCSHNHKKWKVVSSHISFLSFWFEALKQQSH